MRFRAITGLGLAAIIGGVIVNSSARRANSDQNIQRSERSLITVQVRQLRQVNNVIPVELKCDSAELSAPNSIEKLPCLLANNTSRHISAAVIAFSVLVEKDGKAVPDTNVLTVETYLHPDFSEEHRNNTIPPGGNSSVRPLPFSYDDAVIRGVTVWADYIEFNDGTTLGPNQAGARMVADIRSGASKYKNWLAQKYDQSGKSMNTIVMLLEDQLNPNDVGITNGDQEQGAILYRKYALHAYRTRGAEALSNYFKKGLR